MRKSATELNKIGTRATVGIALVTEGQSLEKMRVELTDNVRRKNHMKVDRVGGTGRRHDPQFDVRQQERKLGNPARILELLQFLVTRD